MASRYATIRATNGRTDEFTVVGVMVFDGEGRQYDYRLASLGRAKRRGDYPPTADGRWIDEWAKGLTSLGVVEKTYESIGQAMSCVQLGPLCGSILGPAELMEDVAARFVIED